MTTSKKTLIALAAILIVYLSIEVFATNPTFSCESGTGLSVAASCPRLKADVGFLTQISPPRQIAHIESLNKASDYISAQWVKMGLKVSEQKFMVEGKEVRNLMVSFGPETGKRIVIGAHYDVCGDQPGADDNASGIAGLLELSRMLIDLKPPLRERLDLVAYTLEEPPYYDTPYMGSLIHARSLHDQGVKLDYMISLEMIGYFSDEPQSQKFPYSFLKLFYPSTGNFTAFVGNMHGMKLVGRLKEAFKKYTKMDVRSLNAPAAVEGIDYSDHRSYWAEGYPAVMVTDTSFYRNANYHKPSDTFDTLDFGRMAEVVKGVYGVVVESQK